MKKRSTTFLCFLLLAACDSDDEAGDGAGASTGAASDSSDGSDDTSPAETSVAGTTTDGTASASDTSETTAAPADETSTGVTPDETSSSSTSTAAFPYSGTYEGLLELDCLEQAGITVFVVSEDGTVQGEIQIEDDLGTGDVDGVVDDSGVVTAESPVDAAGYFVECSIAGQFDESGTASGTFTCVGGLDCTGAWAAERT